MFEMPTFGNFTESPLWTSVIYTGITFAIDIATSNVENMMFVVKRVLASYCLIV